MPDGHEQHIAVSKQVLRAVHIQNDARIERRGDRERDARGNVRLDHAGDDIRPRCLRCDNQVNARGAAQLRNPADGVLHLVLARHHEVGQFVDDDDQLGADLLALFLQQPVIGVDFLDIRVGEFLIALEHLVDDPVQHARRLFGVGHDRCFHVRDAVKALHLNHLRVDHEEIDLLRRGAVQDAHDDGVNADALTGSRRPRDQKVRHLGEVAIDVFAGDILA